MATKKVTVEVSAEGLSAVLKLAERLNNTLDQAEKPRKIRAASAALSASQPTNKNVDPTTGLTRGTAAGKGRGDARDFGREAQGLGGLVHLYATFAANIYAVGAAFNALSKAADFTNMEKAADILSMKVGVSIRGVAKDMKSLTDGAISMTDALASASLASSAGLNTTQIKELTTVAKGASIALGRDMTDALQRVFRGTIKIEPELLDELGLMVKVDDANKAYAKTLGKTISTLTDYERRQAFVNAVTTQGISKYKDLADQAANPFSKLLSGIQDLGTGILSTINVALGPFISLLSTSPTALLLGLGAIVSLLLKQAVPAIGNMRAAWEASDKAAAKSIKNQLDYINKKKQANLAASKVELAATQAALTKTRDSLENTIKGSTLAGTGFGKNIRQLTWGTDQASIKKTTEEALAGAKALTAKLQEELRKKNLKISIGVDEKAGGFKDETKLQRGIADAARLEQKIKDVALAEKQILEQSKAAGIASTAEASIHRKDSGVIEAEKNLSKLENIATRRAALSKAYDTTETLGMRSGYARLSEELGKLGKEHSKLDIAIAKTRGTFGILTTSLSKGLGAFSVWSAAIGIGVVALSSFFEWTGLTNDKLSKLTQTTDKLAESFKLYNSIQEKLSTSGSLTEIFTLQASAAQAYADALVLVVQKSKELGEFRDQKGLSGAVDKGTESLKAIFFNAGIWGQNANTGLATEFQRKMDTDAEFSKNNKGILGGKNAVQYIDSMALEDLNGRAVVIEQMVAALADPKLEKSNREFAESSNAMKQNLKELSTISGEYLITLQNQSKHLKAINALSSSTGNLFKQLSSKNGGIANLSEFLSGITDQFQEMSETKLPDGLEKLKVSLAKVQKTAEATYNTDIEAAKGNKGLIALATWNKSNTVNTESQRALEAAGYKKMQDAQIDAAKYTVTTSNKLSDLAAAAANATFASAGLAASLKKTQFIAGLSNRSGDISTAAQYDADRRRVQIENNAKQTNINSLTDQKNADINLLKKLLGINDSNLNYEQLKDLSNRKIANPITDINTSGSIASSISRLAGIEGAINIASADIKVNTLSLPSNLQKLIDVDFQAIEGLYNTQIDKNTMVFGKKTAELSKEFKGLIDIWADTIDSLYSYRQAILDNENELINQKANTKKLSDSLLVLEREFVTPIGQKNNAKNFDQETGDSAARALQQTSDKLLISSQAQKVLEESKIKLEQLEQQRLRNLAITQNEKLVDLVQEQVNLQSQYSDFLLRTTTNYPELNKLAKGQITSLLSQLDLEEKIARAKIANQKLIISKVESLGLDASVTVSNKTDTENKIPELIVTTNSILGDIRTAVSSRKYATGGHVQGAGTATSDSIPAMLSNGEFVVNAASTKKFKPLLEKINEGRVEHLAKGSPSTKGSSKEKVDEGWLSALDTKLSKSLIYSSLKAAITAPKRAYTGELDVNSIEGIEEAFNTAFAISGSSGAISTFTAKGGAGTLGMGKLSLARNPKYASNIPYEAGNLYSAMGKDGYNRFIETGRIAPSKTSQYVDNYFQEGFVNSIYGKGPQGEYIVETMGHGSAKKVSEVSGGKDDGYYITGPRAGEHFTNKDLIRIWKREEDGNYAKVFANFATGGKVVGEGTATSDSIPAMLSNGEFIVNATATKKFGPLLEKINDGQVKKLANGGPSTDLKQASTTAIANANIEMMKEEQKLLNSKLRKMAEVTSILKQQNELTLKIIEQEGRWNDLFSGEGLTAALNIMADRIQETMNKSKSAMSQFATGLVDASDAIIDNFAEMIQKMDETKLTWVSFRDMVRNTLSDMFRNMSADLIKNGVKDLMMVGIAAARDKFAPTQQTKMLSEQSAGIIKEDGWKGLQVEQAKVLTSEERAAQLLGINNTSLDTLNSTMVTLTEKLSALPLPKTGVQGVIVDTPGVLPNIESDSAIFGDLSQTATTDLKSSVVFKDATKIQEFSAKSFLDGAQSIGLSANTLSDAVLRMASGGAQGAASSLLPTVFKAVLGSFIGPAATTTSSMFASQQAGFSASDLNSWGGAKFAKGGIMSKLGEIPLHKYANGGIANSPQLALFGEGSKNEAYVPLPDNRSIPVTLSGSSGGGIVNGDTIVNVTINNSDSGSSSSMSVEGSKKLGSSLASSIKAAVQEELIKQMKPRGMLNA